VTSVGEIKNTISAAAAHAPRLQRRPPTRGVYAHRPARFATAALLALMLSGCNDADGVIRETPTASPSTTPATPSPSPTPTTEEQRILAQYTAFWKILTPTSEAPAAERRQMLEPYAADPELSRVLRGMLAQDRLGRGLYGEAILYPRIQWIKGSRSLIKDCQDASNDGQIERATGKKLTKGTPRHPVTATMVKGKDGQWRVNTVDLPGGTCARQS